MTREDLIASAGRLRAPAPLVRLEFSQKREQLTARVNRTMGERPDLVKLAGRGGQHMSEDNNRNFSLFMESLMGDFRADVLADTVLWVFRAYRSHGFQPLYWSANLDAWMETLKQELSPRAFSGVSPFYAWLITHAPVFVKLTDEAVAETGGTG